MVRDEAMTMRLVPFLVFVLACATSSASAERVLLVEKESLYNNIYIYSARRS